MLKNIKPHHVMQGVVSTLLVVLILVLESKAAIGAHHAGGIHMAALSLVCAAIAFVGFGLAGRLKDDERAHVRRRTFGARLIAVCFLASPVIFLGSALKTDRQASEWTSYRSSPAYELDVAAFAVASGNYERERLRKQITEPTSAELSMFDPEFLVALAVQLLLIFASSAFRVPAPITAEEREHQKRSDAAKKGAATRRAKKARKNVVLFAPKKAKKAAS